MLVCVFVLFVCVGEKKKKKMKQRKKRNLLYQKRLFLLLFLEFRVKRAHCKLRLHFVVCADFGLLFSNGSAKGSILSLHQLANTHSRNTNTLSALTGN